MRAAITIALALACAAGEVAVAQQPAEKVTGETIDRWMDQLSNWGGWGREDRRGTLNLITADTRRAAARLVREGVSVSLAHDEIETKAAWNPAPFQHLLVRGGALGGGGNAAVDSISVIFHGPTHTHLDALCHFSFEGKTYNGRSAEAIAPPEGCARNGVRNIATGIFTRAVLVDVPRLRDVRWIEPGTPIYPADLEAWEKKSGVKIGSGDAVLVRTGRWLRWKEKGPWMLGRLSAGLHASCAPWLRQRDVAVLGTDVGADVRPPGIDGHANPIHVLTLVAMGMPILDQLDFEAAAAQAAKLGRWEFLLTAAPIRIVGGTGSPLNPIVTF
jgi:kynurenine formamidase